MTKEHKGYYSISSRRWVSHAEVVTAENAIAAMRHEATARELRREAYEARADEAARRGDFALARQILADGRASETTL